MKRTPRPTSGGASGASFTASSRRCRVSDQASARSRSETNPSRTSSAVRLVSGASASSRSARTTSSCLTRPRSASSVHTCSSALSAAGREGAEVGCGSAAMEKGEKNPDCQSAIGSTPATLVRAPRNAMMAVFSRQEREPRHKRRRSFSFMAFSGIPPAPGIQFSLLSRWIDGGAAHRRGNGSARRARAFQDKESVMARSRYSRTTRFTLAAALATGGVLAMASTAALASGSWVNTATRATPLPANSGAVPTKPLQRIHVVVGLKPRNKANLDALVVAVSTPGSSKFGQTITPAQFLSDYAPTASSVAAVKQYLTTQGFSNIEVSANYLAISAYGTAASVEGAFNTKLVSFVWQGRNVFANTTGAQVPSSLGGIVSVVVGLQDFGVMTLPLQLATPQNPITTPPYSGPEYQIAYHAGSTPTGHNTAIGIVTEGNIAQVPKDLRAYETEFHLPQVPYKIVKVGVQTSDTAGLDEWDLDSQSSSGIAQNLKQIVFYNAGSLADADLTQAFQRIVSDDHVKAVNMSFGGCETIEYLSGAMLLDDIAFEQGAAEGITFFASSGDGGAS